MNSRQAQRNKRLKLNTATSLLLQATTIVCGFILPRLILQSFGSDINGLVNSITQFLSIIAFLELGVGSVVQSSLYKPLAENNYIEVSKIYVSANKFFRVLAYILVTYLIVLIIVFPNLSSNGYDFVFTATLIGAMSISSFAQYYFGVVDKLLLTADQRGYIQYLSQFFALILNTIACVILIRVGASIQIVKLTTSIIFLMRPIAIRFIVNNNYSIDRNIKYDVEPIQQKWNGVAQHVAAVVLDGTDVIVLTVLASLSEVSVYSIYNLVVYGVKQLFTSMTSGVQALLGELLARKEYDELKQIFSKTEWSIHTGVTFVFGCTASLIVPFVQLYTYGVNDANYTVPLFALLITMANAMHCLRLPYNIMILAGGHYKQTQHNYIVAAVMNIVISVVMVSICGLVGVAIGTICAMLYQTIWMALYNSKNLIKWPIKSFVKQFGVDIVTFVICFTVSSILPFDEISIISWISLAVEVAVIWGAGILIINTLLYKDHMKTVLRKIFKH